MYCIDRIMDGLKNKYKEVFWEPEMLGKDKGNLRQKRENSLAPKMCKVCVKECGDTNIINQWTLHNLFVAIRLISYTMINGMCTS